MESENEVNLTNVALPRSGHIAVAYDKYIIVWGGYCDDPYDWYLPPGDFWVYDSEFRTWTVRHVEGTHPYGLSGVTACIQGENIYIFGGHGRLGNVNDLWRFDLLKWEWEKYPDPEESGASPRDKAVSWFYRDKFYVFGGFGPPLTGYLYENGKFTSDDSIHPTRGWNNQLLQYDVNKRKWSNPKCTGDIPCPRAAHASAQIGNKAYVFGGRYQTERLNDLHCFDIDTLHWSGRLAMDGNTPEGRSWHSLSAVSEDRLFLYGGFNTSCQPLSDAWILDVLTLQWTQLKHIPDNKPRLWHTACVTPSKEVIIHGGCSNNILDYQIQMEHCSDVLHIQLQPFSLLRLCLDCVYKNKDSNLTEWDSLPEHLREHLRTRQAVMDSLAKIAENPDNGTMYDEDNPSGPTCSVS